MSPVVSYELTCTVIQSRLCNGVKYGKMLASKQWDFLQFYTYEVFKKYNIEYYMVPEFHKNNNIHTHSHVILPESLDRMDLVDIKKRFENLGRCSFTKIHNLPTWLEYMDKNQSELSFQHYKSGKYEYLLQECP